MGTSVRPATPGSPEDAAGKFIDALTWGDHIAVWWMFSEAGRRRIVEIGVDAGLDPVAGERMLDGSAHPDAREEFLVSLMHGLRADFDNLEGDRLVVEPTDLFGPDSALVDVTTEGFLPGTTWPIGQFQLVHGPDGWQIDSFKPHRTLS